MGCLRTHGATELPSAICCPTKGQGATEYLILLAVVLIIALVSVALLGFFPGMASDAQETQSRIYWSGASPISIVEIAARHVHNTGGSPEVNHTAFYLKIKNTGPYRISITKILANGTYIDSVATGSWGPIVSMNGRVVLSPGEEFQFGRPIFFPGMADAGSGNYSFFFFCADTSCWGVPSLTFPAGNAKSYCSRTDPYGSIVADGFGFEYTQYMEGQQITKRQIGSKPLMVKCMNNKD